MKIKCYECKKLFDATEGFYVERRITNPDVIPASTVPTGYGYCSKECADRRHILEHDIDLQDLGNYEETDSSVVVTSPDGGVRGEILNVQNIRRHGYKQSVLHPSKKLVSRSALAGIVRDLKQQGKTIVTTNGSFDLLHIGHVSMLQEAKSLGDVLIVGLNSDAGIRRYKGQHRPICSQAQRVGMLSALACTDYITVFDELTPIKLLNIIRPHIHVNSPEHGEECIEREIVELHGGRIHLAQLVEGMSTTQLIERILEASSHPPCQGIFINAKALLESSAMLSALYEIPQATLHVLKQLTDMNYHLFILVDYTDTKARKHAEETLRQTLQETLPQREILIYADPGTMHDMIEQAVTDFDVILAKSFVLSGDMADIQIGREMNCKTLLLQTQTEKQERALSVGPHSIIRNFQEIEKFMKG